MNLTDEQIAICQAARDLAVGSSLKIQAFAGTGKTTTLAAIAESLARRKFLYLVFNPAAADEAERKMPSNVMVRTRMRSPSEVSAMFTSHVWQAALGSGFHTWKRRCLVLSIQSYAWEETRLPPGVPSQNLVSANRRMKIVAGAADR